LNKVDFPTFGNPTIPHCKAIYYFNLKINRFDDLKMKNISNFAQI
jgi:hypothetical protein